LSYDGKTGSRGRITVAFSGITVSGSPGRGNPGAYWARIGDGLPGGILRLYGKFPQRQFYLSNLMVTTHDHFLIKSLDAP
jgi:hypothetical protein